MICHLYSCQLLTNLLTMKFDNYGIVRIYLDVLIHLQNLDYIMHNPKYFVHGYLEIIEQKVMMLV